MCQTLSISLDLPEFKIINQYHNENHYFAEVIKESCTERCPFCGFQTNTYHDSRTRTVRDLPIFNKPLFLKVIIIRFRCRNCNEVFSQSFDSINPGQKHTLRFREYLYEQCHEVTIRHVSKAHQIPYTTVERIYYSIAQIKLQEQQTKLRIQAAIQEEVTVIGIDEIAVRKGHVYETVLVDLLHGGALDMTHGRSYDSTLQLLQAHSVLSTATL